MMVVLEHRGGCIAHTIATLEHYRNTRGPLCARRRRCHSGTQVVVNTHSCPLLGVAAWHCRLAVPLGGAALEHKLIHLLKSELNERLILDQH